MNTSNSIPPSVGSTYYGATPATAKNQLSMSTFITLLTSQLQAQDPTQPLSSDEMAAQISELGQMQAMSQMNQDAQMQQAQGMLGQLVTAPNPNSYGSNLTISGIVTGVSLSNGAYNLSLQEADGSTVTVPASSITAVSPTVNLAQLSSYMNHVVDGNLTTVTNGTSSTQQISGMVTGVSVSNGVGMLSVKTSNGTVQLPSSAVTQIVK